MQQIHSKEEMFGSGVNSLVGPFQKGRPFHFENAKFSAQGNARNLNSFREKPNNLIFNSELKYLMLKLTKL